MCSSVHMHTLHSRLSSNLSNCSPYNDFGIIPNPCPISEKGNCFIKGSIIMIFMLKVGKKNPQGRKKGEKCL